MKISNYFMSNIKKLQYLKYKKKSVWRNLSISFGIVFLIPLIFGIVIYTVSLNIVKNEAITYNNMSLEYTKKIIDSSFENASKIVNFLKYNDKFQNAINSVYTSDGQFQYEMSKLRQELADFSGLYMTTDVVYVYIPKVDIMLTSTAKSTSNTYFEVFRQEFDITKDEWQQFLINKYNLEAISFTPAKGNKKNYANTIFLANSISLNENNVLQDMNIFVSINAEDILVGLNGKDEKSSKMLILDRNNKVLLGDATFNQDVVDEIIKKLQGFSSNSNVLIKTSLGNMFVRYIQTPGNPMKYLAVSLEQDLFSSLFILKNVIVVSTLIMLLLGIYIILINVRKNYYPLQNIIEIAKIGVEETEWETTDDEYSYLKSIIEKNSQISNLLNADSNFIKVIVLNKLLKGYNIGEDKLKTLSKYGIEFPFSKYVVMVIKIDDYKEFFNAGDNLSDEGEKIYIEYIINNVVLEIADELGVAYAVREDNLIYYILNLKDDITLDTVEDKAGFIRNFFSDNFMIYITVSISDIKTNVNEIFVGVKQATKALAYKYVLGKQAVLSYNSIKSDTLDFNIIQLEQEKSLILAIETGNEDGAIKVVKEIISNIKDKQLELQNARFIVFSILNIIIKEIQSMSFAYETMSDFEINISDFIGEALTMNETEERLITIISKLCQTINNKASENSIHLRTIEYVNENYSNLDLNVTYIAQYFNLNQSYLSSFFKRESGIGLLEYVNRVRVEKSKELLKQSEHNLEYIASLCGFTNVRTYLRIFKKFEKMTPGKYRELYH